MRIPVSVFILRVLSFGAALAFNLECLAAPLPVITGFSPGSGPPGTIVRITGRHLGGATAVTFNGVAASSFNVVSSKQITSVVPLAASTGPIFVTTAAGTAASANSFVVEALTLTVTTSADSGAGSLREAIDLSNGTANSFTNHIFFSIGSGLQTINVASALPNVLRPVMIDGTSQPGYAGAPLIELNGASAGDAGGLVFFSGNSTVRGLVINRFGVSGIVLNPPTPSADGNYVVEGCFIGTDVTGALALGNGIGVSVRASGSRIGGTAPGTRNVISGNTNDGIAISDFVIGGILIQGNFIGTDSTGTASLGNGIGIRIGANCRDHIIGGTQSGAGNVIAGNRSVGISLFKADTNTIQGNLIGTDRFGSAAIPNMGGLFLFASSGNLIGGSVPGAANLISGNLGHGIVLSHDSINPRPTDGNVVQGNRIGLDTAGGATLGNAGDGVRVDGGPFPGAFRGARQNAITANAIAANGGLGINLVLSDSPSGVTPNDVGDTDSGPNNGQNFPVPTAANTSNGTVIAGTLNSLANTTFVIELFSSSSPDPSGFGEGQFFLGSVFVTTDANGDANFTFTTDLVLSGQIATATARDFEGNTSEFSLGLVIQ
ncbi:MAG TPA: hypothetical protein VK615_05810 [Candidatus Binatia bacterium]|nr:hypothetical protein [Candidatus Binatia bacterium]